MSASDRRIIRLRIEAMNGDVAETDLHRKTKPEARAEEPAPGSQLITPSSLLDWRPIIAVTPRSRMLRDLDSSLAGSGAQPWTVASDHQMTIATVVVSRALARWADGARPLTSLCSKAVA